MESFITKTLNLDVLYLDTENPRFITPPNTTEQDIINYLLEYEEIEELAKSINTNRGLYAGERVIVCKEDNKYIVLEGNRRISACKILKNKQLLANYRPASAAELLVHPTTLSNISMIEVDVMKSRTDAQSSLAAKHIDGIRRWSPISKKKFFSKEYSIGKSIAEIQLTTGSSSSTIKNGIKEYNLINYALNLNEWTNEENNILLDLQKIKISPFTRVFTSTPKNKEYSTLSQILKLEYSESFQPISTIDKDTFNHCIYLAAKASFDKNIPFDTRSTFEDIPGLLEYIILKKLIVNNNTSTSLDEKGVNVNEQPTINITTTDYLSSGINPLPVAENLDDKIDVIPLNKSNSDNKSKIKLINKELTSYRNNLIPSNFNVCSDSIKINNIISELKQISLNSYINSPAVLLRVLIELSAKYYLTNNNATDRINENDLRQTVNNALNHMRDNRIIDNKIHSNISNLGNKDKAFNIFNGYIHYDGILPIKSELIGYFDNYSIFILKCLEKK